MAVSCWATDVQLSEALLGPVPTAARSRKGDDPEAPIKNCIRKEYFGGLAGYACKNEDGCFCEAAERRRAGRWDPPRKDRAKKDPKYKKARRSAAARKRRTAKE